jgi:hypothetical protein
MCKNWAGESAAHHAAKSCFTGVCPDYRQMGTEGEIEKVSVSETVLSII